MYVGVWSRLEGFERDELTAALERRAVVQATLLRMTIHLVSRADYWPFALATRAARRAHWLRAVPDAPTAAAMAGAARTLRRRLAQDGELRRGEVEQLLGKTRARGVGLWLDLVRVPPSGTWERRRADIFRAAEDWIGPPETTVRAATEHLVRRYLAGFGPASAKDVASFTGLTATALKPVLAALEPLRFHSEDGEELLDLPGAPLPDPGTPAPPRFLPTWDATLLVHARRTGLLPREAPAEAVQHEDARTRSRRSWSTARWPAGGATSAVGSNSSRSEGSTPLAGARWPPRASAWPRSTPRRLAVRAAGVRYGRRSDDGTQHRIRSDRGARTRHRRAGTARARPRAAPARRRRAA